MSSLGESTYDDYHAALAVRVPGHAKRPWVELPESEQIAWETAGEWGLMPLGLLPDLSLAFTKKDVDCKIVA